MSSARIGDEFSKRAFLKVITDKIPQNGLIVRYKCDMIGAY